MLYLHVLKRDLEGMSSKESFTIIIGDLLHLRVA
jgi:hypothetical protein